MLQQLSILFQFNNERLFKTYSKLIISPTRTKRYYNIDNNLHRLRGPAVENYFNCSNYYYINNISFLYLNDMLNYMVVMSDIIFLEKEEEIFYIKLNLKELLIKGYELNLSSYFVNNKNTIPLYLKDFLII